MAVTFSAAGGLNGCVPLTDVTGETTDISELLDLDFMMKFGLRIMLACLLLNRADG